jgi:hypothetical protein
MERTLAGRRRLAARLLLICSCAALTACTAAAPKGPDTTVTTPAVGRPPAPQSAQAALSSEAFTPYADLGGSANDGLAPGETYSALHDACMSDAGYGQFAGGAPFVTSGAVSTALTLALPFGWYGYLGTVEAAQHGFMVLSQFLGQPLDLAEPSSLFAGLPAAAQAAAGKCFNVVMDFDNAQLATSMAGIETMGNAISNDVAQDPDLKNATKAWSACMARNGYTSPDANTLANQELQATGSSPSAAQNQAQIASAVADADCTLSSDLGGIYFALQASYEQQVVTANQQALNAAVREYKANYARELSRLPALLRTASATPAVARGPAHPGGPAHAGPPRPAHS